MRYQRAELPLKLDGLVATRKFFAGCMADADPTRENLWVAHVDEQSRCVHLSRHAGDEIGALFPLRTIIADAAEHGSAGHDPDVNTGLVLAVVLAGKLQRHRRVDGIDRTGVDVGLAALQLNEDLVRLGIAFGRQC